MSLVRMKTLFDPKSIAVIGASMIPDSLGTAVMRNLLNGEFHGPILPVNTNYESVLGVLCYKTIDNLPVVPDLAIICTPPATVPKIIDKLGEKGTRLGIVMTTNPEKDSGITDGSFRENILKVARSYLFRVLGHGSIGIILPYIGLNASWINTSVIQGKLAIISQSGSLLAGILEWAKANDIGFSHVISPGEAIDIDLGDLLDYLAMDWRSQAILLNLRGIQDPRKFLSAARAVARIKPVIVIKSGSQFDVSGLPGQLNNLFVSEDEANDAAIRRAGMLRVYNTYELFDSVETLTFGRPLLGERLAIICNGNTPGQMAADNLLKGGGQLAKFSENTVKKINSLISSNWNEKNPVDLGRDATDVTYKEIMSLLLSTGEIDALLVMHIPTPLAPGDSVALAVSNVGKKTTRNVLACWLGQTRRSVNLQHFSEAKIPVYVTPDDAVRAFLHLIHYRKNQEMLMEIPSTPPPEEIVKKEQAHVIISNTLKSGRTCLNEEETSKVLSTYGLKVVETRNAMEVEEVVAHAKDIGFPVSLRLSSPSVIQPFALGNMSLDQSSESAVWYAAIDIKNRFAKQYPGANWPGFVIQNMVRLPDSIVLMAGIVTDATYGPLIMVGRGGVLTNSSMEHAVALPPLNMSLAGELISRTVIGRMLSKDKIKQPINEEILRCTLVELSRLVVDMPQIISLNINPLLINNDGVLVIDSRLAIQPTKTAEERLAIKPYPRELEENFKLKDGRKILVRPIRPEDEPAYVKLLEKVSKNDLRQRFFGEVHKLPHSILARLIHIDYDREMAFVATNTDANGEMEIFGVVNIMPAQLNTEAEYAILIRTDSQGLGLGRFLMEKIIRYCRNRNMECIQGIVLANNTGMLMLTEKLGFTNEFLNEEDAIEVRLILK